MRRLVAVVLAAFAAGCTPGDAPEATVDLTAQVYVGAAVDGASPDHAVLRWVVIEPGGRVVGFDGCNSMTAELGANRAIRPMVLTEAGCPGREPATWGEGTLTVSDGGNTITMPGADGRAIEFHALINSAPSVSLEGSWALSGERVLALNSDGTAAIAACEMSGTWTEAETVMISLSPPNNACRHDLALFDGSPLEVSDVVGISGVILRRTGRPTEGPYAVQLAERVAGPDEATEMSVTEGSDGLTGSDEASVTEGSDGATTNDGHDEPDGSTETGEPGTAVLVASRMLMLDSVDGAAAATALRPSLMFESGQMSGYDGCNWFSGQAA